ncbi:ketosteroid isomerase [Arthrobacter frigidicola]|nr:ketosteroid isomerase [Arthrobacter frigidicola]
MNQSHHGQHLTALYQAFNERDLTRVLAAMTDDVAWPNGWEGGRLVGQDAVRRYWERQWAQVRVAVHPTGIHERPDGRVEVRAHQVVRDSAGAVLDRSDVCHVYAFRGRLVQGLEVAP